jgi:hypothetical protein
MASDFTLPLVIALAADAVLVVALAAQTSVGSPLAIDFRGPERPPREVSECGDGAVERLVDDVRDEQDERVVARKIGGRILACGRWWFDPTWAYSLCAAPRFDQLLDQLLELHDSGPGRYPGVRSWRYGDSSEEHVLSELLAPCKRMESHGSRNE